MRVVLVDPTLPWMPSDRAGWAPLGLAYLAAVLRQDGHEVHLHNRLALQARRRLSLEALDAATAALLAQVGPGIVGLSGPTASFPDLAAVTRLARQVAPRATIVVGGPHATILPEETLARLPEADCLVVGEGEQVIAELARGRPPAELPGVHWREAGGGLRSNPWSPPGWDLDSLPFPARDLMDMRWYAARDNRALRGAYRRALTLLSSRGCAHRCAFCAEPAWTVRGVRYHSPEYTVAEAEHVVSTQGADALVFLDEMFTGDRQRVLELAELWQQRGLHRRVVFGIQARADALDAEILAALKRAGCLQIDLGLEFGSQHMLDLMGKGTTVDLNRRAVELVQQAGIRVWANFILGAPGETEEDFRATVHFIEEVNPDLVFLSRFFPVPNTGFARELVAQGRLALDFWATESREHLPAGGGFSLLPAERFEPLFREACGRLMAARNYEAWLATAPWWRVLRSRAGAALRRGLDRRKGGSVSPWG